MPSMCRNKNINVIGNQFLRPLFNGTVYTKFCVCFTTAKYESHIFLSCETSNAFIHAFCHSKIHFHQHGQLKMIKTMLKSFNVLLGSSPVWNCYLKGSQMAGATKRSIIAYDEIEDKICKDTEMIPIA